MDCYDRQKATVFVSVLSYVILINNCHASCAWHRLHNFSGGSDTVGLNEMKYKMYYSKKGRCQWDWVEVTTQFLEL